MGQTGAAFAEGAQALFWNPAGLARLTPGSPSDLIVGYSNLIQTTYAGSAAYARPTGPGVIGASLVYFSQAPQTGYNATGDASGQFTPYDIAAGLSYGMPAGAALLGATVKLIRSSLGSVSGATAAVDFGVQVPHATELGDGPIDLGASISNLGPPLSLGSVSSALPFSARGGFLWRITPMFNGAADVVLPVDNDPYVALGAEFVMGFTGGKGALRLGYDQNSTRTLNGFTGLTAGAGLQYQSIRVDYAWAPFGELGTTNRVTLGFNF